MVDFIPFAKTAQSTNLGDLVIESDEASVVISGVLEISPTEDGRDRVKRLRSILDAIELSFDKPPMSRETSTPPDIKSVKNPFS